MEFLDMTRDAFIAHLHTTTSSQVDKITIGAAITRTSRGSTEILLLKRNANEAYYPNVFEMPGGKVDADDASIRRAVEKEVAEETGLTVSGIRWALSSFSYTTEKTVKSESGKEVLVRRRALQLSYVVEVDGDGATFTVNKEEHSTGTWASRNDLDGLPITSDMKKLVEEALGPTKVAGAQNGD